MTSKHVNLLQVFCGHCALISIFSNYGGKEKGALQQNSNKTVNYALHCRLQGHRQRPRGKQSRREKRNRTGYRVGTRSFLAFSTRLNDGVRVAPCLSEPLE